MAVKVMTLPLVVYHPRPAEATELKVAYRQTLGICVVGSFITTYIVKELLQDVLTSLQCTPYTDISLLGLAKFVASFLRTVSREVCQALFNKGKGQIILTGYCPIEECGRAFVLSTSSFSSPLKVEVSELFQKCNIEFFGSGKSKANSLYNNHSGKGILKLLKEVIEDEDTTSVGGNVQYGCLEEKDFRVFGMRDYKVDHEERCIQTGLFVGGVRVMTNLPQTDSDFVLSYTFKNPFTEEINKLLSKGYRICKPS